jgi:thioesterase domain-containing protein/acyl carrier protein
MYGPTETTIWSTIAKIERGDQEITIGRPIANTETYILDKFLQPVPIGASGELYIGGHGLARGYCRRPELTKERFVLHPFSLNPQARLYRTGDVVRYRPDGRIVHLGRLDNQVKIRGFRIELGEIEALLSRHPAVRQVVATAWKDKDGLKHLTAYVVCKDGQLCSAVELRSYARTTLPDYMTPSFIVFLDAIPLTDNNKIDMQALPDPALNLSGDSVHAEPRDRMEVQLAALWQQVLGVPNIGIHDNFFDLGGHSLKAAQLFYLIEQVYGRHLPLATLFQAPTIAALTSVLTREQWVPPWQSLVAIHPEGLAIPIFMVPGVGGDVLGFARLARLLSQDHPVYGLQARGFDGKETPFFSVQEMAKHYIGEIRTCRPRGPYVILGACTGGLVAYEMAQQLVDEKENVTLIMMNSWHPISYRPHLDNWPIRYSLPLFLFWMVLRSAYTLWHMPLDQWVSLVQRKCEKLFSFLQRSSTEDGLFERMEQAMFHAAARYTVRKYPGRILNIVASKRNVRDTRYVWAEQAGEGCQTFDVSAARTADLLISPHVEEVTSHIQRFLAADSSGNIIRPPTCDGAVHSHSATLTSEEVGDNTA